jgi:hypothetical protein
VPKYSRTTIGTAVFLLLWFGALQLGISVLELITIIVLLVIVYGMIVVIFRVFGVKLWIPF